MSEDFLDANLSVDGVAGAVSADRVIKAVRKLTAENERLKSAIREHRDQKGDDRCFEDDARLYAVLGEGDVPPEQSALPPRCDFLASCERYWARRQHPDVRGSLPLPDGMTIAQLTQEVERLTRERDALAGVAREWLSGRGDSGDLYDALTKFIDSTGLDPEPGPADLRDDTRVVLIDYVNWRGERSHRRIVPQSIRFGSNEWHPEPQYLLEAIDAVKGEVRTFAMKDIHAWKPWNDAPEPGPAVRYPDSDSFEGRNAT